jgi:hypothetical protein
MLSNINHRHFIKLIFVLILLIYPATVPAQLINIKTIPVATGDQFLIFPSQNLGIGGVSLALDDSLGDPFVNPAKGDLINGTYIVSTPSYYSITDDLGSAQTLPLTVLSGSQNWFGTVNLSLQEVTPAITNRDANSNDNKILGNSYFSASVGRHIPGSNISLGASLFWARLKSLGGVEYLYGNSTNIEQNGDMLDLRVGLVARLKEKRTIESIFVYNRYDMTHLVDNAFWRPFVDERMDSFITGREENRDRTHTYGLHLGYTQPFFDSPWRLGGAVTINHKMHPKIPNYQLMNIPRDPGVSWAYNIGLGMSRTEDEAIIGFDFIYEPIWSHTWADAAEPFENFEGIIISEGQKTVENYFTFSNWILRLGVQSRHQTSAMDLGFTIHRISYNLHQKDYRINSNRHQQEQWFEYTASFGYHLYFKVFEISYMVRATLGTGIPSTRGRVISFDSRAENFSADFLPAPDGPLRVDEAIMLSQRIMVVIPIGN